MRQLRAFVLVAETGGFASASRRLHLTPSALSLLIKEMEAAMQVRLFDRTTRSTVLSQAGAEFYPLARKLLGDLQQAVESTRDLEQIKRGTVRIACTPLYASMLLPRLIQGWREQYPAVTVYVLDSLHEQALARLRSGEADLCLAPQRKVAPDIVQELLFRDRMWLICPPDHPMAASKSVTWAQVMRERFVSLTQDFTAQLQVDLMRHSPDLALQPAHDVAFLTTALGMVASGFGITVQPEHALELIKPFGLVARPVTRPVVHRSLSLFRFDRQGLSPAAESFAAYLRKRLVKAG
ncbi:MAG: LysR family transcriptional regulator [Gammaproteobacteria bacterium]|nr:LysR family transcriptional regulator [Gammaproteobacteria bacterium]